jgi:chromosome segregation ATPase
MSFEDIKSHLDRLFAYRPVGSSKEQAAGLRGALVDMKAALGELREALVVTEAELVRARKDLADSERRRELAAGIDDQETVRVADEHLTRLRSRLDLLERKVLVQRDEVHMADREYEQMRAQYQRAAQGLPLDPPGAVGGGPDGNPPEDDPFLDRRSREAAVDAQLEMLKKKLGRE